MDNNPLIQNDLRPIRGWSIVIFLAVLPLLLVPAGLCWWALRSLDLSRRAGRVR